MPERRLVVGLGNPGRQYEDHRHNVGFMVVSELARQKGVSFGRMRANALVCDYVLNGLTVTLAKPQTFMNNSGQSVGALVNFYKLPLEHLLVVYDDVDLPVGTLRMKAEGGHGGQNGMRSIIQHLGASNFARLRIGIGRPAGGGKVGPDYVLKPFSREQAPIMEHVLPLAVEAVTCFLTDGIESAMNLYNRTVD